MCKIERHTIIRGKDTLHAKDFHVFFSNANRKTTVSKTKFERKSSSENYWHSLK